MFKTTNKSRTKRVKPLVGLTLKSREWVVKEGKVHYTQLDSKEVQFNTETEPQVIRQQQAITAIEAKYCVDRKLVGVKSLRPLWVELALRLSAYWYYEKKFRKTKPYKYRSIGTMDNHGYKMMQTKDYVKLFVKAIDEDDTNMVTMKTFVTAYISDFNTVALQNDYSTYDTSTYVRHNLKKSYAHMTPSMSEIAEATDVGALVSEFMFVTNVCKQAYRMTMATRKDSNQVSNKKIKEVAQFLYDELQKYRAPYHYPSEDLKDITDITLNDDDGMLEDSNERLERKIKDVLTTEDHVKTSKWGNMKLNYPELTERLPVKITGKRKKYSDMGVAPRAMHRHTTDGKVFSASTKRKAGTLLIDVSGSMSFSERDIDELVRMLPAATVAMYSGTSGGDYRDEVHGHVHILAKNGKYVKRIPSHFRENIIDGPAMDWLGKQEEPRIMVTDMQVSGIGYNRRRDECESDFANKFMLEALQKVKQYRITPINDIGTAKEYVKKYLS